MTKQFLLLVSFVLFVVPIHAGDLPWAKSVWADATLGDDSTGTRTNAGKPFATLEAAKTNALAGDTIFVRAGVYNPAVGLMKSNVNWHFFNGTIVTNTGSSMAMFDDYDGVNYTNMGTVNITGDAELYDSGTYGVIAVQHSGTDLRVECKKIKSMGNTIAIALLDGNLTVHAKDVIEVTTSSVSGPVWVYGDNTVGKGNVTFNNSRIYNPRTNAASQVIHMTFTTVANTNLVLRDCVLISSSTASYSIDGDGGSFRIYGSLMATKTNNATTILTGSSRFEVGDVK